MKGLDKSEQNKVKMKFFYEITKYNPLRMVEIFWKESQRAIKLSVPLKKSEKKIMEKPTIKKLLHKK